MNTKYSQSYILFFDPHAVLPSAFVPKLDAIFPAYELVEDENGITLGNKLDNGSLWQRIASNPYLSNPMWSLGVTQNIINQTPRKYNPLPNDTLGDPIAVLASDRDRDVWVVPIVMTSKIQSAFEEAALFFEYVISAELAPAIGRAISETELNIYAPQIEL